jgi:hypothetical protein
MKSTLYFLSIPIGFVLGGVGGVAGSIYLLFFFGVEQVSKTAHHGTYWPILSYILLLLCSKVIIFLAGVVGAFVGCSFGFVGLAYEENKVKK